LKRREELGNFFQEKFFEEGEGQGGAKETKQYFFRLSNMSPKDVTIHLMYPVQTGAEVAQRLIAR
jgi:hypothetical protein